MGKFRKLSKKVTPLFKYDPEKEEGLSQTQADETKDGDKGKGILVRKYIKNLDMDFYAGRAVDKGKDSVPISTRMPADLMKDVGIMLATQKTRFRDRSEFVRTAVYILMNYYAQIVDGPFRERVGLRKTEDLIEYEHSESTKVKRIIDSFEANFQNIAKDGDEVLHKYLIKIVDSIRNEKRHHIKDKLVKAFSDCMERGGVDPSEYFDS